MEIIKTKKMKIICPECREVETVEIDIIALRKHEIESGIIDIWLCQECQVAYPNHKLIGVI